MNFPKLTYFPKLESCANKKKKLFYKDIFEKLRIIPSRKNFIFKNL